MVDTQKHGINRKKIHKIVKEIGVVAATATLE